MTKIYTFLQKRKMQESHHGIIMIIAAYVLSFLMLFFGSDTFYNVTSKAERIPNKAIEETNDINKNKNLAVQTFEMKEKSMNNDIDDMKSATDNQITKDIKAETTVDKTNRDTQGAIEVTAQQDTVWFLGHSMDSTEYDNLLDHMSKFDSISDKAVEKDDKKRGTIKAYSEIKKGTAIAKGITEEEVEMLERIVEAEATGEDITGRILIANVIFNRIMSGHFPKTVEGVIFQRTENDYQFSPISDHRFWSVRISEKTKKAVSRALAGEDYSEGALYFMARRGASANNTRWFDNNLNWLFKHGGHEFYK